MRTIVFSLLLWVGFTACQQAKQYTHAEVILSTHHFFLENSAYGVYQEISAILDQVEGPVPANILYVFHNINLQRGELEDLKRDLIQESGGYTDDSLLWNPGDRKAVQKVCSKEVGSRLWQSVYSLQQAHPTELASLASRWGELIDDPKRQSRRWPSYGEILTSFEESTMLEALGQLNMIEYLLLESFLDHLRKVYGSPAREPGEW